MITTEHHFITGMFECEHTEITFNGMRWKITNNMTGYQHFTYGTREEVVAMCKVQSLAWERRSKLSGIRGSAWRHRTNVHAQRAEQKKTAAASEQERSGGE